MTASTAVMVRTEARLFARDPASLFWIITFPTLLLVILGLIPSFREPSEGAGSVSTITLYVPVAILLSMLMAGISAMPVVLATYREQRILRRIATTPARAGDLLVAQYVIHGGAALVGAVLAVIVARVAYGVALPENLIAYALTFLLVLGAALALGGVIAGVVPNGKTATTFGTVLVFPLMFTAGVWIPVSSMPELIGGIVSLTPFGAGALALDAAATGDWPEVRHFGVLTGWIASLCGAAARYFRWE
jgi:ABC-2 type transport system permease protein